MKKFIALTFGAGTLFLTGYCTVSAQTTNIISNSNNHKLLTQDQAETLALRLADGKVTEELKVNYPVFEQNLNRTNALEWKTRIQTKFVDGHWDITLSTADIHDRHYATVELASDGVTNSVVYRHEGGLP